MTNDQIRDLLEGLNASRKADREKIAAAMLAICARHGATVERRESEASPGFCGKGIDLRIQLNGVGAMIDIDNLHGGEFALVSWFNDWPLHHRPAPGRYALDFAPAFNSAVGDLTKFRRPHHKATSCPSSWFGAAMCLDGGLEVAARGDAFLLPESATLTA